MADSFGLKIGLEGEKEFKKALADINQSFKVLGSEMKLATSQFDKNDKSVEALAARNKVLRKEIDEQTTKIDTLRKALQNAATSFGENDRRTQNWQIQLNNAEAALNDMNRELDENEKAINEGGKAAEESGSKFEGFGKVLKTVGVALGAVAVAAGAAAVKLGKEVIAAYADYEQLVGGVDTLFKDSSQEIQRYAANAYKTAGLSANEYMETVTGFSASLIQSLGGDTEKAAKYADMAITDMSDNANKMGTDMPICSTQRKPSAGRSTPLSSTMCRMARSSSTPTTAFLRFTSLISSLLRATPFTSGRLRPTRYTQRRLKLTAAASRYPTTNLPSEQSSTTRSSPATTMRKRYLP